jgi:small neutral amino acid transporter SnatA (MarC family)
MTFSPPRLGPHLPHDESKEHPSTAHRNMAYSPLVMPMRSSLRSLVAVIGRSGMNALTRMMGFLLPGIGIQFIVNGVLGIATDPAIVRSIRDATR